MTQGLADEQGTVTADNHFTMLPDWILEHPDLSDRAVRVWLILMSFARSKDIKDAWLGRRKMAEKCKCSVDTIDRALKELVTAGALSVQPRFREDRSHTSNNYHLHTSPHGSCQVAAPRRLGGSVRAAPREKAPERDPFSSSRSRPFTGRPAGSEQSDDEEPTTLDPWWRPNHTHHVMAADLGLDINEMVEEFRSTYAAVYERRNDWDKTFGGFMNDFAAGSNHWAVA